MTPALEFKPRNISLTLIRLTDSDLDTIAAQLQSKLAHTPQNFFSAMPMAADLTALEPVDADWLRRLKQTFAANNLTLIGTVGANLSPEDSASLGLADIPAAEPRNRPAPEKAADKNAGASAEKTAVEKAAAAEPPKTTNTAPDNGRTTKTLRGAVRSGQRVYAPAGDLIIIGHVGAGAEIIADGNIHILGTLRGRAFAGAQGDEDAHIYASDFDAELISIAGSYQTKEQLEQYKNGKNCLITLNKDETMLIVSL